MDDLKDHHGPVSIRYEPGEKVSLPIDEPAAFQVQPPLPPSLQGSLEPPAHECLAPLFPVTAVDPAHNGRMPIEQGASQEPVLGVHHVYRRAVLCRWGDALDVLVMNPEIAQLDPFFPSPF
jgi:hypothetical protein